MSGRRDGLGEEREGLEEGKRWRKGGEQNMDEPQGDSSDTVTLKANISALMD